MSAPNASCIINELLSRWRLVTKVLGLARPAARPARLHAADGARTAVALRQMRRAGQGLARSGNFGRGIKYQACPSRRRDPRAVRFEFPVAVKRQPEIVVDR